MTLCKCGCGEAVKKGNMFIHGHNMKGSKRIFTKASPDKENLLERRIRFMVKPIQIKLRKK